MRFEGALIKEQGITFGIVVVQREVFQSKQRQDESLDGAQYLFPGVPVVIMAQDHRGRPEYYGRTDIVNFLANVPFEAIPWAEYERN